MTRSTSPVAVLAAAMLAGLVTAFSALPVQAEAIKAQPRAVAELFTSQGCSSCPPADAVLKTIGGREDVLALAYHVDYWDYIGWADTFGSERYSDLQRGYARSFEEHRIYTPQLVVNGQDHVIGSRGAEVNAQIRGASLDVPVGLSVHEGILDISVPGDAGHADEREVMVWLIPYRQQAEVAVERGENRGKTLTYTHIVTGRTPLGMWDADKGATMRLPLADILMDEADGVAVLVQCEKGGLPGEVIGAAAIEF
ncbi:DUF1223 domain-containing protein [Cucumibacter marinus]|uniref:DUF1223 domain-containing protein n=1 Tax=Cucumibacter marinus TaxID=1121252 RepID=UPI00048D1070|nr:DUF1223 domain-containing protein [Cucumibacter marinus]